MIKQWFELKTVKKIGLNSQSCKFYSSFECVEIGKSRTENKSIRHILPPLSSTNLRKLQEVSMIDCYKRYYVCKSQDNCQPCSP